MQHNFIADELTAASAALRWYDSPELLAIAHKLTAIAAEVRKHARPVAATATTLPKLQEPPRRPNGDGGDKVPLNPIPPSKGPGTALKANAA